MTQEEFIKKFLPDYDKKLKEEIPDFDSRRGNEAFWLFMDFCNKYFEEALQNFTNKICEAQRKECAESASIVWIDVFDFSTGYHIDENSILNAEQPKIEDL